MVRVQIYLEDDMNHALEERARREGVSKAALIRGAVARELPTDGPKPEDAWDRLIGMAGDLGPIDDIDEVIYGLSPE